MARTSTKEKSILLSETLNKQVANFSVLYMKLHHYHWYIKGDNFFTLHVKFEELYSEAALHVDTIAERLLVLGGTPISTLQGALELTTIEEATGDETSQDMVQTLTDDIHTICTELTEGITSAEDNDDQQTADLFTSIRASLEKHRWMLKAYLAE
jgi:starvation-inducible DNA-binding protein